MGAGLKRAVMSGCGRAAVVELHGALGLRVLVQQAVDFRNDLRIGLPRFTVVLRQGHGERLRCASLEVNVDRDRLPCY